MDLWWIAVTVKPNGTLTTVKKEGKKRIKKKLTESDGSYTLTYARIFQNYCSFGMDARIGIGFEQKRKKSKLANKITYAWEGFKKSCLCCLVTPKVKE